VYIQQIENQIYRIAIPIPFPMKYVYCYLFKDEHGWAVVDTGFNYSEAIKVWEMVFSKLSIKTTSIHSIYLTHYHPDHSGLAGWMQTQTGAHVYMSETDYQSFHRAFGESKLMAEGFANACVEHGMPRDLAEKVERQFVRMGDHVLPLPEFTILEDNRVRLSGEDWDVIPTPGHSDGMICFYQPKKQLFLAADHVLDKITPNIGLWPYSRQNPLEDYLQSLEKISSLEVKMALPAHGKVINDLSARIKEITLHHEERLNDMFQLTKDGKTAYETAVEVFKDRELNSHQWRFALAETLAHLEYLHQCGRLIKSKDKMIQYHANQFVNA